ncbi:AgmX/PglI C-terminal domain-containing protein [bacterium]|nr:AgmX/PglI C-terminal domain-containing protein [bacterium]
MAQQQLAGFPKELEASIFDDIDWTYNIILAITFILFVGVTLYFQSLPEAELSEEELTKYLEVIYRVETKPQVVQEVKQGPSTAPEKVEEIVEETQTEKKERQKAQRAARDDRRQKLQSAARSTGLFASSQSMNVGKGGARGAGKTLSGGGIGGGASIGNLSGIASGSDVAKIEKLRGGGTVMEGGGEDIDIGSLSLEEIDVILESSTVEIEGAPQIEGKAASEGARSQQAIRNVILGERSRLTNCYTTQKKKDLNLRGKVIVEYTITASGTVQRVNISSSDWSNRSLGRAVERCLKQRVARWRFDPASADVTSELPLLFK